MAHSKQARKRIRQADKRNDRNVAMRSMYRTYVKRLRGAVEAKEKPEALKAMFAKVTTVLDMMASKNIIHKNKAGRLKSRLSSLVKAAA